MRRGPTNGEKWRMRRTIAEREMERRPEEEEEEGGGRNSRGRMCRNEEETNGKGWKQKRGQRKKEGSGDRKMSGVLGRLWSTHWCPSEGFFFFFFSQKIGGKHEQVMTTWPHCECALPPSLKSRWRIRSPPRAAPVSHGASYLQEAGAAGLGVEGLGPHAPQIALWITDSSDMRHEPGTEGSGKCLFHCFTGVKL